MPPSNSKSTTGRRGEPPPRCEPGHPWFLYGLFDPPGPMHQTPLPDCIWEGEPWGRPRYHTTASRFHSRGNPQGFGGVLSRNFAPVSNREVQPGTYKNRIFKNRSMGLGQALFITLFVSHARHPDDESGRPIRRPSGPSRPPKSMIRGPSGPSRPRKSMFEAPSNNPRVC